MTKEEIIGKLDYESLYEEVLKDRERDSITDYISTEIICTRNRLKKNISHNEKADSYEIDLIVINEYVDKVLEPFKTYWDVKIISQHSMGSGYCDQVWVLFTRKV